MALHVSQLDYEHREIVLRDKPAEMLSASPKGTVPVFVEENGDVIEESLDLLHHALTQNDPLGWLECERDAANALIEDNDGPFKHHLDRYKYASRYNEGTSRGDIDLSHRAAAEKHLQRLETKLETRPYLLGQSQSYADIAIFPFIRQFANTDIKWWTDAPYPNLRRWLASHIESDLFATIMTKHPIWVSPSEN